MTQIKFPKLNKIRDTLVNCFEAVLAWLKNHKWIYSINLWTFVISCVVLYLTYKSLQTSKESLEIYKNEVDSKISPIDEEQSVLLLNLLVELNRVKFRVSSSISVGYVHLKHIPKIDLTVDDSYFQKRTMDAPVYFIFGERDSIMSRIMEIADNPLLPMEVKEKMAFLYTVSGTRNPKNDSVPYRNILYFSKKGHELSRDKDNWTYEVNNECSLKEYIEKYQLLYSEINLWIEKTTKTKGKLNL